MAVFAVTSPENQYRKRYKKCVDKTCSKKFLKKRLPILEWLPKYQHAFVIQDIMAGITVGLTAIAQGIAYAVLAGLPPEQGLYASLTAGIVYVIFGSCHYVTVGPTAIISAMTAKYVASYSVDFAVLAAFLSGVMILAMGVFNLGFLVEFISMPVIGGFTTAAALQIAASQLKSLFGLSGTSGDYFAKSIENFINNISTIRLWETVLGFGTILMLTLLRKLGKGCSRTDNFFKKMRWFVSLSRNALVVNVGMIIAYTLKLTLGYESLEIIGDIGSGLPNFSWPPFSTTVGNETLTFTDMLSVLGPQSVALPLVAILESVAIAKAFSGGATIDATQEMIALGMCNIIGSFGQSLPITGSFARTALNHVSGVQTPAGGLANVFLIIIALTLLTSTFYYIPKASLAGLIIFAMFTMIDFSIMKRLWKNSKRELFVLLVTMFVSLFAGLEYGIMTGIILEAVMLLYKAARPPVDIIMMKHEKSETDIMIVPLSDSVSYCAAEHIRRSVLKESQHTLTESLIIIDATNLRNMDFTVASNLISVVKDLEKKSHQIILLNFILDLKKMCVDIEPKSEAKFQYALDAKQFVGTMTKNV